MARSNPTPNPRFRVERMGAVFLLLDYVDIKYEIFYSRIDADRECVRRNGAVPKRSPGLSIDAETGRERALEWCEPLTPHEQRLVDNFRSWLPASLRAWALEAAAQLGYGGARRKSWPTYKIMKILEAPIELFKFSAESLWDLHYTIWPSYPSAEEPEFGKLLAIHYLSPDTDIIKGAYFGFSRRQYQREVDAAHRWLAREVAQHPHFFAPHRTKGAETSRNGPISRRGLPEAAAALLSVTRWRQIQAREDSEGEDDHTATYVAPAVRDPARRWVAPEVGDWALDAADRANLRLVK